MQRSIILLALAVLFLPAGVRADTHIFYVDDAAGSDGYSPQQAKSQDTPWKTIQKALNDHGAAPGDSVAIKVSPGTYRETANNLLYIGDSCEGLTVVVERNGPGVVEVAPSAGIVKIMPDVSDETSVTFRGLEMSTDHSAGGNYAIWYYTGCGLCFEDCTISNAASSKYYLLYAANGSGSFGRGAIVFDNCTVAGAGHVFLVRGLDRFEVRNRCTVTAGAGASHYRAFYLLGQCRRWIVEDSTITCPATVFSTCPDPALDPVICEYVRLSGNTATSTAGGGISIWRDADKIDICDNNITSATYGVYIGSDFSPWTGAVGIVRFRGNTINAGAGHALFIGDGAHYGEYSDNIVTGGDYAVVVKGCYNRLHHNVVTSGQSIQGGIYLVGTYDGDECVGNQIYANRVYADSGNGTLCFTHTARSNVITHNILFAEGAARYAVSDNNGGKHGNNIFDFNRLTPGAHGLVYLNGDSGSQTIEDVRAIWRQWDDDTSGLAFASNDENSVVDNTPLPEDCLRQPEMDFNGDCRVTFEDVAIFAGYWLACGLEPTWQCQQ
ncbi:MAG: hypothetical protein JW720_05335 [Sedimentisphaerales bacterium]|nr:hypothetical protein [Sedimentisphaerales bacterium]